VDRSGRFQGPSQGLQVAGEAAAVGGADGRLRAVALGHDDRQAWTSLLDGKAPGPRQDEESAASNRAVSCV
jgi:hypothetical protein